MGETGKPYDEWTWREHLSTIRWMWREGQVKFYWGEWPPLFGLYRMYYDGPHYALHLGLFSIQASGR